MGVAGIDWAVQSCHQRPRSFPPFLQASSHPHCLESRGPGMAATAPGITVSLKEGGNGARGGVESSGVRENAVGTWHNQQVSPTYAGRAGGPVEVHSNFWTGDLTLLQPAAHPAQVSKGSPVQVCAHLEWNCYSSPNVVGGGQRFPFPKCLLPPGGILSGFPQTLEMESLGMKLCPRESSSLVALLIIQPTFLSKLSSAGSQLEAHSMPDRGISCIRDARAWTTPSLPVISSTRVPALKLENGHAVSIH